MKAVNTHEAKRTFRGCCAEWPPARKLPSPTAVFRWRAWFPCLPRKRSVYWECFADSSASRKTLTRRCPTTCLIYSKDENLGARRERRSKHEVFARYERVSVGPFRRTQTQPEGATDSGVLIVGVVFLGSRHMGNRY